MTTTGPDVLDDILSEAWRRGAARPVAIHVRKELLGLLGDSDRPAVVPRPGPVDRTWVSLIVDDDIPPMPGYEIHRAPPTDGGRPSFSGPGR